MQLLTDFLKTHITSIISYTSHHPSENNHCVYKRNKDDSNVVSAKNAVTTLYQQNTEKILLTNADGTMSTQPLKDVIDEAKNQAKSDAKTYTDGQVQSLQQQINSLSTRLTNVEGAYVRKDVAVKIRMAECYMNMPYTEKRACSPGNRYRTLYQRKTDGIMSIGHEMDLSPNNLTGVDHPRYAERFYLVPDP